MGAVGESMHFDKPLQNSAPSVGYSVARSRQYKASGGVWVGIGRVLSMVWLIIPKGLSGRSANQVKERTNNDS